MAVLDIFFWKAGGFERGDSSLIN